MSGAGSDSSLWEGMATGVQRLLASGPLALSVREAGSVIAFSGTNVADLNMAFAWEDTTALNALSGRFEDFLLVASPAGNDAVAQRAGALALVAISEPLPVWVGAIEETSLPPSRGMVRRVDSTEMGKVHSVLAQAFGLDVEPLALAFPTSIADDIDVYLSEREGVGIAALMAVRKGNLVSLWSGGTIPEARGQGVFTDLLSHALRDQGERGARTFAGITEAVASGRVVERLGGKHHTDAFVWVRGSSVGELLQE